MISPDALLAAIAAALRELRDIDWSDLLFGQLPAAVLVLFVLLSAVLLKLAIHALRPARPGAVRVTLPALLPVMCGSRLAPLRHVPLVLFAAGVPFFAIALADPFTAFTREEISRPGRRIAVMIDASTSMMSPFASETLNTKGSQTYFTTVAAAERFMTMRMQGPNRDLISLIEFGSAAYVVTPFTTDYQSIVLAMRLIGDWDEWQRFPDQGTTIMQAIQQGVRLFAAFDFLKASGNLMVIFTDGQDSQAMLHGLSLDEIMAEAREQQIPVYMVRMAYSKSMGDLLPDRMWQAAIERTGGRFYAATDEDTILAAVREIDELAPGRINLREYNAQRPRFAAFTLAAASCWAAAALLKLGFRGLRTFP